MKPIKMLVLSLTGQCNFACVYCYAMNGEAIFVNAKGDIYVCSSLMSDEYCMGNVTTGICVAKQTALAEKIKTGMGFCFTCPDFKLCGGGCYSRWVGSSPHLAECALKRVSIEQCKC